MNLELKGNIIFKGKLNCKTGLHIGGSKDKMEIGGVDSPVIRDPYTNHPYIPGSSIKGKTRSLLEVFKGVIAINNNNDPKKNGSVHNCTRTDCAVCRLFGSAGIGNKKPEFGPTRLIFRDAFPDSDTIEMWKNLDLELLYTEHKVENNINRLNSSANPRHLERIIAGSKFDFELVFTVYDGFKDSDVYPDIEFITDLLNSLRLLQETFLGGNGSRGYGKILIDLYDVAFYSKSYYQGGMEEKKLHMDKEKNNIADIDVEKIKELIN